MDFVPEFVVLNQTSNTSKVSKREYM